MLRGVDQTRTRRTADVVCATSSVRPIESRAWCNVAADTPVVVSIARWYWNAKMLPSTATPSAPPVWRVVSLIAEPTPARCGGSDPMIDSVTGAMVMPMPSP